MPALSTNVNDISFIADLFISQKVQYNCQKIENISSKQWLV